MIQVIITNRSSSSGSTSNSTSPQRINMIISLLLVLLVLTIMTDTHNCMVVVSALSIMPSASSSSLPAAKATTTTTTTITTKKTTTTTTSRRRRTNRRTFQYVPYGESAPTTTTRTTDKDSITMPTTTIACDGRIPGATLEVTHWTGNKTPDYIYSDTSTEMAIKLASLLDDNHSSSRCTTTTTTTSDVNVDDDVDTTSTTSKLDTDLLQRLRTENNVLVLNNHYDTDGICSVWALLTDNNNSNDNNNEEEEEEQPLVPLYIKYKDLLIEGAEAGDFGEWNTDRGIKLDMILSEILCQKYNNDDDDDEAMIAAYEYVLKEMPSILKDMIETGGQLYKSYWNEGYNKAIMDWHDVQNGSIKIYKPNITSSSSSSSINPDNSDINNINNNNDINIVIVEEKTSTSRICSYALHRALIHFNLWNQTTRILRVNKKLNNNNIEGSSYHYCYEKIGHGWVSKLVDRHIVPDVDKNALVDALNEYYNQNNAEGSSSSSSSSSSSTSNMCLWWSTGGPSGLTSICQNTGGGSSNNNNNNNIEQMSSSNNKPEDVAKVLAGLEYDLL